MDLFATPTAEAIRLRVAAELARQRTAAALREARMTAHARKPICALQFDLWGDAIQVCSWAPPRRRKPAARRRQGELFGAAAPARVSADAVASIFALAAAGLEIGRRWFRPAPADAAPPPARVIREAGTVRLERLLPQETEEWQERERARRAKQRPPKPTKKARTRGEKLLALIGEPGGGKDGA